MNIKCKNILLKGSLAVLLSLLSLIFIGISSAKAQEYCATSYGTWTGYSNFGGTNYMPAYQANFYLYNKCNPTTDVWKSYYYNQGRYYFFNGIASNNEDSDCEEITQSGYKSLKCNVYQNTASDSSVKWSYSAQTLETPWLDESQNLYDPSCICLADAPLEPNTPPEPPETPNGVYEYLLYYGANPYYVGIGQENNLPIIYNICDTWDDNNTYSLYLVDPNETTNLLYTGASKELTNCSGLENLNVDGPAEQMSSYAMINIIENGTTIIEQSEPFLFSSYAGYETTDSWIKFNFENPAYIQAGTETTALTIGYYMAGELATGTEICLIDKDRGSLKLDACEDAESGYDIIEISMPVPNFQTTKIMSAGLFDKNTGNYIMESPSTMIIIYDNSTIKDEWNNQFSATGTSAFLGLNSYDMACSQENWTSTSTFLGINFTKSLCETKKFGLDILFISGTTVQKTIMSTGDMLSYTFPFGLYRNIVDSWNESANQPMPEDLKWLIPINTNGDITINLPPNLTNGTSTEIIIFGKTIFEQEGTPADQMFKNIRALSTYLLWVGFLLGLGYLATDIYIEMKKEKTK